MALKILQPGIQPLGQYDALDAQSLITKGGEVACFVGVTKGTDNAAFDAEDGYINNGTRTVATTTLTSGARPLMLVDDGISGYGTVHGSVLGGVAGKTSGPVIGPHTATGSGKWTLWDKPGLYGVTLDAVAQGPTGLQPTNATLLVGAKLYATVAGLLTPVSGDSFESGVVVGTFVEFRTDGSLVTTPAGNGLEHVTMAVFHFSPQYA